MPTGVSDPQKGNGASPVNPLQCESVLAVHTQRHLASVLALVLVPVCASSVQASGSRLGVTPCSGSGWHLVAFKYAPHSYLLIVCLASHRGPCRIGARCDTAARRAADFVVVGAFVVWWGRPSKGTTLFDNVQVKVRTVSAKLGRSNPKLHCQAWQARIRNCSAKLADRFRICACQAWYTNFGFEFAKLADQFQM